MLLRLRWHSDINDSFARICPGNAEALALKSWGRGPRKGMNLPTEWSPQAHPSPAVEREAHAVGGTIHGAQVRVGNTLKRASRTRSSSHVRQRPQQ